MTTPTRAAVLVPIHDTDPPRIGFVVRATDSTTHGDDVGFPGGKPEPGDDSLRDTALRELDEETALSPGDVTVRTRLDAHATRSSGFELAPLVATVDAPDRFQPDSREVAATFWRSVPELRECYEMDGDRVRYRGDREVWGVTARVVTSLLVGRPDVVDE